MNCKKCDGAVVYPEGLNGEKICIKYGLFLDETPVFKILTQCSPEWHSYWNEQARAKNYQKFKHYQNSRQSNP